MIGKIKRRWRERQAQRAARRKELAREKLRTRLVAMHICAATRRSSSMEARDG